MNGRSELDRREKPAHGIAAGGPARRRGWQIYLVLGICLSAPYFALPSAMKQSFWRGAISMSAACALMLGIRWNRPRFATPWYLLVVGLLLSAFASIFFGAYEGFLRGSPAAQALADLLYLTGYAVGLVGLYKTICIRSAGYDSTALIDSTIIAFGVGILSWLFLMEPYTHAMNLSPVLRIAAIAYPLVDVVMLGMLMRLWLSGISHTYAFAALGASMLFFFLGDTLCSALSIQDVYYTGHPVDMLWLLGSVALGVAGLHPSMNRLVETISPRRPRFVRLRLALLTGAALLVPAVMVIEDIRTQHVDIPIIAGGSIVMVLLVLARMQGMARESAALAEDLLRHRSEERFRSLVQNASDIIAVLARDGVMRYLSPSVENVLGYPARGLIDRSCLDLVYPADIELIRRLHARLLASAPGAETIEVRLLHHDGGWRHFEVVANNLLAEPSVGGIVVNARDITERKQAEVQLTHLAFHDALTSLPNRVLFLDRLNHALARAERLDTPIGVLFLDLDSFKVVNDSLGHDVGDQLLVAVAQRIRAVVRPEDTASRFGGDEFAILLERVASREDVLRVAERILETLRAPFTLNGHELYVSASIGIALSEVSGDQASDLLQFADVAMYQAKNSGKSHYELFDRRLHDAAIERLGLEQDLRHALERREFRVYYQPTVDLFTGDVVGLEALVRWESPQRGFVLPMRFIPLAEETGLIVPIGLWVLEEACRQAHAWHTISPGRPLEISVNLSARQFQQPNLVAEVSRVLSATELRPSCLKLEITESAIMEDIETTIAKLHELKDLGIRLAIDDFGIGYSSLNYLKRFPVDTLKIDRSFVAGLGKSAEDTAIAKAVTLLAHTLGLSVTAEGVETADMVAYLNAMGCELGQGYYFARPLPSNLACEVVMRGSCAGLPAEAFSV